MSCCNGSGRRPASATPGAAAAQVGGPTDGRSLDALATAFLKRDDLTPARVRPHVEALLDHIDRLGPLRLSGDRP